MTEGRTRLVKHKPSPYDYIPTAKEEALLLVLLNPAHRMATVTRVCELVGISRTAYYDMHRKPEFSALYRTLCLDGLKQMSGQLMQIGIREARKGGAAGYPYWRDLMKMSELLPDEHRTKLEANIVGNNITLMFVDPLAELDSDVEDDD